ncbi:MAG: glycosyltransferase [Capsulimonadales bacterium]|nr:glycosyltransferase [Capsulimonadales bacterium]
MKIAIVHDYLAQAGGAERVVEAMHELWPEAPIYTSVYDPQATLPSFRQMDIRTSFLQRFKFARQAKTHKYVLPLFPLAFEHFDLRGFDVVLSHTTSFAKGVITEPETCHICYCHTPSRFAWRYHEYISQGNYDSHLRSALPFLVHFLRNWDLNAAHRVDYFLSNSHNIARRVRKYYSRDSEILYPPVETRRFNVEPAPSADYYLVVSRLQVYKRVDLAIQACNKLKAPLKIVGGGPELARLKAMAGPTVEFLGRVPDGQVESLFANCRAFLFPGEEDFGIAPLEAMASGRPVIAFGSGGALETIVEGVTGLFFCEQTADSLADAIQRLNAMPIDPRVIREHSEQFDTRQFHRRLQNLVELCLADHRQHMSPPRPRVSGLSLQPRLNGTSKARHTEAVGHDA